MVDQVSWRMFSLPFLFTFFLYKKPDFIVNKYPLCVVFVLYGFVERTKSNSRKTKIFFQLQKNMEKKSISKPIAPPAGLQAIINQCLKIYPDQPNPLQVTTVVKYWLVR